MFEYKNQKHPNFFHCSSLLYSSCSMFLISTLCTLLALAQFLTYLCKFLSSFWVRMEMAVTTEETNPANMKTIKIMLKFVNNSTHTTDMLLIPSYHHISRQHPQHTLAGPHHS